jgi:hypothetical protein
MRKLEAEKNNSFVFHQQLATDRGRKDESTHIFKDVCLFNAVVVLDRWKLGP